MPQSHSAPHSEGSMSHDGDSNDESDYHDKASLDTRTTRNSKATSNGSNVSSSKKKPTASRRMSSHVDDGNDFLGDPADPQNARKMQNRLAQREFRARRLEHIKELEARVEFLSKPQSEQTEILVAIIHGLMDENKQLRGTLKTMAGFIASGIGGVTHDLRVPEYSDALELVNRGDKALLLKLVQEKGGHVGPDSHRNTPTGGASSFLHGQSPPPSAVDGLPSTTHTEKKRKAEHQPHGSTSVTSADASTRPTLAKAPRTRSQNNRGSNSNPSVPTSKVTRSQEVNKDSTGPQHTPRDTPPERPSLVSAPDERGSQQHHLNSMTSQYTNGNGLSLSPYGVFAVGQGQMQTINGGSNAMEASFQSPTGVKQEESPPIAPFQDPASTWMNAYTNLTPMGGEQSFWSLTSSAMNQNQQAGPSSSSYFDNTNDSGKIFSTSFGPQQDRPTSQYAQQWNNANQIINAATLDAYRPHSAAGPPSLSLALNAFA